MALKLLRNQSVYNINFNTDSTTVSKMIFALKGWIHISLFMPLSLNFRSLISIFLSHLSDGLHRADVGVWTEEDVLELRLLLVDPLHGHLLRALFLDRLTLPRVSPAVHFLFFRTIVLVKEGLLLDTAMQLC